MKLKNNGFNFNIIIDGNKYKISKGNFEVFDEVGLLLLFFKFKFNIEPCESLNLTDNVIDYLEKNIQIVMGK